MTQLTDTIQDIGLVRIDDGLAAAIQVKGGPGSWELWSGGTRVAGPFQALAKGDPHYQHGRWALRVGDGNGYRVHSESGEGELATRLGQLQIDVDGSIAVEAATDSGIEIRYGSESWGPFDDVRLLGVDHGRVAFWSKVGEVRRAHVGDAVLGEFERVAAVGFTPDSVVFTVRDDKGWWVVNGDQRFGPYKDIGPAKTSGENVFWPAEGDRGWSVYVNGKQGPVHERVGGVALDTKGRPLYYALESGKNYVHWNETKSQPWELVSELPILSSGTHLAYAARAQNGEPWSVVVDGSVVDKVDVAGMWLSSHHVAWLSSDTRSQSVLTIRSLTSGAETKRTVRLATQAGGGLRFEGTTATYTELLPEGLFRIEALELP